MVSLQPVRGAHDLLPEAQRRHRHVEQTALAVSSRYGYQEMSTPIFEFTEVFVRTLGETSDIVTKEMYTFKDRGGATLTLRPEGTAGVARAFISGSLQQKLPLKAFYRGAMFRRERPQKGRQRQFHQVGVEFLGVSSPMADAETIAMGADFLAELGLGEKVVCQINTLGDAASREDYRARLVEYFQDHRGGLSENSLVRLEKNPMRILDSKDEGDKAIAAGAPLIDESLNDESKRFFDELLAGLDVAGVAYEVNPRLVRGLDYYCHTAFEFTTDALGAQGTVLAGGRYDGLIERMGGPATAGIGWAAGVERLAMLAKGAPSEPRPIVLVPVGEDTAEVAFATALMLRRAGFTVDMGFSGNLKKRLARANKVNAAAAVILGSEEMERGVAVVRDMDSGMQAEIPLTDVPAHLKRYGS